METQKYPFNKLFIIGNELKYIQEAITIGKLSGNGDFTKKCQSFFVERYSLGKVLLTFSCTNALEMSALLMNINSGDEVIMPSYTFVSTANAFVLRGAKIVFADSKLNHPNIDEDKIEELITSKTKAIIVAHYGGVSCNMDAIKAITKKYNLFLVEDAAQAIDSYYKEEPLGSIGDLSTFSFHETKNLISGEGGLLGINNKKMFDRAEIIWEKGTNRSAFFREEVAKYEWVDLGSSYSPSELTAAFLYAQLENLSKIQTKRKKIVNRYFERLQKLEKERNILCPQIPDYATNNAHNFYIVCNSYQERKNLLAYLKQYEILAVFHYMSLHRSPFYKDKHGNRALPNADRFENCLLRLPVYYDLAINDVDFISDKVLDFFTIK